MAPKNGMAAKSTGAVEAAHDSWQSVGTVVGYTSTDRFTFILRSLKGKLGDIVACRLEVPTGELDRFEKVTVWSRIIGIDRFNPFFPAEAAQELVEEGTRFLDTVLSNSRDHLEAEALILGITRDDTREGLVLSPLTYPVKPSEEVLYPPTETVQSLLTGEDTRKAPIRIGSLIGRSDVRVELSARHVISRHLAILAMTGGGKTVAARRILRELIDLNYPLVIFDPHGDYLGLYEKRDQLDGCDVRVFYPRINVEESNLDVIRDLIEKMSPRLTEPQQHLFNFLLSTVKPRANSTAIEYIQDLLDTASQLRSKRRDGGKDAVDKDIQETGVSTYSAVTRTLTFVLDNLRQMDANNERLRNAARFKGYQFERMPDPKHEPEKIVAPGQVSIFYLAGYDHLNQSAIVSIILESLFAHRATLSGTIAPFQAVIEEAHNFIPSRSEGTHDTPSLRTIRKVITEGRKFGTGLILISQRPSRLDETTLAQCNSFLVLRLVNPNDKRFVRSVMENLTEADADVLQTFGPGQGLVSGQAVKFPLLVRIEFDKDLLSRAIGDEDFLDEASKWKPSASQGKRDQNSGTAEKASRADTKRKSRRTSSRGAKRKGGIKPEGF